MSPSLVLFLLLLYTLTIMGPATIDPVLYFPPRFKGNTDVALWLQVAAGETEKKREIQKLG